MRNSYRKSEEKRSLRRSEYRWEDNTAMELKEREGKCGLNSCGSRWGPMANLVKTEMNLWIS
jgi:hypothetical protein